MSVPDNAEYVRLAHEAKVIIDTYIEDMARLDPQAEATDGMHAAYNWLVHYERIPIDGYVCVLCGAPWPKSHRNDCEACGGFCTWGQERGGEPTSWKVTPDGWIPNPVPAQIDGSGADDA